MCVLSKEQPLPSPIKDRLRLVSIKLSEIRKEEINVYIFTERNSVTFSFASSSPFSHLLSVGKRVQ